MKSRSSILIFLCMTLFFCQIHAQNQKGYPKPKLVVGVIIDQMRWDYMYRLYNRYGDTGFKRLLNEGFSFENCLLPYIPSVTAIGHSTVYTGSVPSIHGICGNDFIDQATGKSIYCTQDPAVKAIGINPESVTGKMSPNNLKVTTVTDQLRYASNFRSKVIGVALKDRGSILPAGHAATAAYWYDSKQGKWITSSYYMDKLPQWLTDYNDKNMPAKYLSQDWKLSYPINTYTESPDPKTVGRYEGGFTGYPVPNLPMKTSEMMKTLGVDLLQNTPYGNDITVDVAELAVENENLGHNPSGNPDFLAVSFSSPDKMAHQYSINTILTEDAYIKLDKTLGDFFSYLDQKVGKGNYVLFLTADHAGTPNALFMNDHKLPGATWDLALHLGQLNDTLSVKYGRKDLVRSLENYQINFNYQAIAEAKIDINALKKDCIGIMENVKGVLYAVDMKNVEQETIPHDLKEMIVNAYNRKYCGEIQIVMEPGVYERDSPKGGTHGIWSPDDTHIPFVMMGWGVPHGSTSEKVFMTDIAPTVAAMLHIQMPNGCIGTARDYMFKK